MMTLSSIAFAPQIPQEILGENDRRHCQSAMRDRKLWRSQCYDSLLEAEYFHVQVGEFSTLGLVQLIPSKGD